MAGLLASIDLSSVLANPAIKQDLLASIDLKSMLSDPSLKNDILGAIDLPALAAEVLPDLLPSAVPAAQEAVCTSLAGEDPAALETCHSILFFCLFGSVWLLLLYVYLLASVLLTVLSFTLYLFTGLVATGTFQFVWWHCLHIPRAVLLAKAACRLPTLHSLLKKAATAAAKPAADADPPATSEFFSSLRLGDPATDPSTQPVAEDGSAAEGKPSAASELIDSVTTPLNHLIGPLALLSCACLVTDALALLSMIGATWAAGPGSKMEVGTQFVPFPSTEQWAVTLFLLCTLGFLCVDLFPALAWPLVKWAAPPTIRQAMGEAASAAKQSVFGKKKARAAAETAAGVRTTPSASTVADTEAANRALLADMLPPPAPPPGAPPPLPISGSSARLPPAPPQPPRYYAEPIQATQAIYAEPVD